MRIYTQSSQNDAANCPIAEPTHEATNRNAIISSGPATYCAMPVTQSILH
jgi:hypothetical protein